jgi:hypothetical protein
MADGLSGPKEKNNLEAELLHYSRFFLDYNALFSKRGRKPA